MTSYPSSFKMAEAVELSTPPLMATATRPIPPGNIESTLPFSTENAKNTEKSWEPKRYYLLLDLSALAFGFQILFFK
jgi:hypothetical protein